MDRPEGEEPNMVARCPSCSIAKKVYDFQSFCPNTWHEKQGQESCDDYVRMYGDKVLPREGFLQEGLQYVD